MIFQAHCLSNNLMGRGKFSIMSIYILTEKKKIWHKGRIRSSPIEAGQRFASYLISPQYRESTLFYGNFSKYMPRFCYLARNGFPKSTHLHCNWILEVYGQQKTLIFVFCTKIHQRKVFLAKKPETVVTFEMYTRIS